VNAIKFRAKITNPNHLSYGGIVEVEWLDLKNKRITFNGVATALGFGIVEQANDGEFKLLQYSGHNDLDDNGWNEEVIFHQGAFCAGDENFIGNVHFRSRIIGDVFKDKKLLSN